MRRIAAAFLVLATLICTASRAAERTSKPPNDQELRKLLPAGCKLKLEEFRGAFTGECKDGYNVVQPLFRARAWPALRAIVEHGQSYDAWIRAVRHYVRYEPRWTAGRYADAVRAWSRRKVKFSSTRMMFLWDSIVRNVAGPDKRTAARLGLELLDHERDDYCSLGCQVLERVRDRYADKRLLEVVRKRALKVRGDAVVALAAVRRGGPLPNVTDARLVELLHHLAGRPERIDCYRAGHLAAALPGPVRAPLWHTWLAAHRVKKRPWDYPSKFHEDLRNKPRWKCCKEELEVVRKYLGGSDADLRGWAGYYLAKWQDIPSYPRIVKLLGDPDPEVRRLVANGISWHSTPQFVPALRPLLQDKDRKVVAAAAAAIGICGDQKSVPQLVELLNHKDIFLVSRAATGLKGNSWAVGNAEVRTRLKAILARRPVPEDKWDEYWRIAWALVALCTREDIPALRAYAKEIDQLHLVEKALDRLDPQRVKKRELQKLKGQGEWPILFRAERGDREAIAELLAGVKPRPGPESVDANLMPCLRAMLFGRRDLAVAVTRPLLHWDYGHVSEIPAHVAGRLKDKRLVAELIRAVRRSDVSLATRIWALGEIGEKRAISALLEVGLDPRWVVKVTDAPDALSKPWYPGHHRQSTRLLVEVTSEALEKITGHEILERDPVKLAKAWRAHFARKAGK
jgi:HEAT repeat protein